MFEVYLTGAVISTIAFLVFYFIIFNKNDERRFFYSLSGALLYGAMLSWVRYADLTDNQEACASSTEQKILVNNVCYIKVPEGTYIKYDAEILKK